jgi:hypothetical protein
MKYRNLLICFLAATILFLQMSPVAAAEIDNKTVLLKVLVPSAGG